MKGTLGDSEERTRWRSKQNLDYAYVMMYAQNRGTYYVQMDDDVLSKKGFVTTMKAFALENTKKKREWIMLDFCQLGSIGKLFRSSDLWKFIEFLLLFHQDQPEDWLLSYFFKIKYCQLDYNNERCIQEQNKHWIPFTPSLFQHVGLFSSLEGKLQKLKAPQFGKVELFTPHNNPPAKVESTINHYQEFTLENAYEGKNYFWGLTAEAGDTIKLTLASPIALGRYRFVSGNAERPSDKLHDATLEILPYMPVKTTESYTETKDGYFIIDEFDESGCLEGSFPSRLNPVASVRIKLKNASENWIVLSEILLEEI